METMKSRGGKMGSQLERWGAKVDQMVARAPARSTMTLSAVVLALVWALALVTSVTLGGFIHVLIVLAAALLLLRVIRGPRPRGRGERSGG